MRVFPRARFSCRYHRPTFEQQGSQGIVTVGELGTEDELEVPIAFVLPAQSAGSKLGFEGYVTYRSPAGHWPRLTLNRVTVRVVEPSAFRVRDGVAAPVAERVLKHLPRANVLETAWTRARDPQQAEKKDGSRAIENPAVRDALGRRKGTRGRAQDVSRVRLDGGQPSVGKAKDRSGVFPNAQPQACAEGQLVGAQPLPLVAFER